MVSESLRGIISQQLIPRADGSGRVLALEILTNTPAVANCIREGKTFMLPGIMQTGKNVGMTAHGRLAARSSIDAGTHHARRKPLPRRRQDQHEQASRCVTPLSAAQPSPHFSTACPWPYIDQFFRRPHQGRRLRPSPRAKASRRRSRVHGDIIAIRDEQSSTAREMAYMMSEICGPERWERYRGAGDLDFAYEMDEDSRFRCNYLKQAERLRRRLPSHPDEDRDARPARHSAGRQGIRPPARRPRARHRPDRLRQVDDAGGADRLHQRRTSRGTSSRSRSRSSSCTGTRRRIITQREVPMQTPTFADGLNAALREDADIVLVGEMRDLETISARADRRGDRPARLRHAAHEQRAQDRGPYDRRLPRRPAGAGAHHARQLAARRRRPAPLEEGATAAAASR